MCEEQIVADGVLEYFPAVHPLQAAAPDKEKLPATQEVHSVFPCDSEYLPAGQSSHTTSSNLDGEHGVFMNLPARQVEQARHKLLQTGVIAPMQAPRYPLKPVTSFPASQVTSMFPLFGV